MKGVVIADDELDSGQFPELNRLFYDSDSPRDYFLARLRLVAAAEAGVAPEDEIAVGRFLLRAGEGTGSTKFAVLESFNLFHHAAETTWRLFLAQEPPAECPMLEIARIRRPQAFKTRLDEFLQQPAAERAVRCRAVLAPQGVARCLKPDLLDQAVDIAALLLGLSAQQLLDDAFQYNATKHGLNVDAGFARIALSVPSDAPSGLAALLERTGPWISSLEVAEPGQGEQPRWVYARSPLTVDAMLARIGHLTQLLGALWSAGRCRFGSGTEAVIDLPSEQEVRSVFDEDRRGIRKVRRELRYEGQASQQITFVVGIRAKA